MRLSDYKGEGEKKQSNITEQDILNKYNEYKDLPSEQLNQELFKEVSRQKMNGTFDYQKLKSMLEGLRGSLSEENYQNMLKILESLQ